jgi:hypothetical protein
MPRGGIKGNKGGGRKSAYQEKADAEQLWAMFDDPTKIADIRKRVESGVFSVRDVMQLKMLGGNERLIAEVFKKLFPDLEKVDHSGGINITVKDYNGRDGEKK